MDSTIIKSAKYFFINFLLLLLILKKRNDRRSLVLFDEKTLKMPDLNDWSYYKRKLKLTFCAKLSNAAKCGYNF